MSKGSIRAARTAHQTVLGGICLFTLLLALTNAAAGDPPTTNLLTREESDWLKARAPLRWATNINAPPFGFLQQYGRPDGINPELMSLLARQLDVEMKPAIYSTWSEMLVGIQSGACDVLAGSVLTQDADKYLLFSHPYQNLPIALFVNRNAHEINSLQDMAGHRVGATRQTVADEWLRREHPDVTVVPVASAREGLLLLSVGQLDGMATSLLLGQHVIVENALNNLSAVPGGPLFHSPQCLAVRKGDDRLLAILQKGLDGIPREKVQAVFAKWNKAEPKPEPWQTPAWLLQGGLLLMALGAGILGWNYSLRRRLAQQAKRIREQMEREREMELHCAELIENAIDMVFTRDMAGNYLSINPAGRKLLGYTEEEASRLNLTDVVAPGHLEKVRRQTAERFAGEGPTIYELEVMTKDGRRLWLEASLRLLRKNGQPVAVQGISRDITQRKRAEAAIEQERKFLRTLIDNMPDLVYTKDTEARFVISNLAHLNFMGVKAESDLAGKTVLDLHPPELARRYHADDLHVLRTGDSIYNREEMVRDHLGVTRWHLTIKVPLRSPDGTIIGLIGVTRDINEHKKALESLRASEMLYHSLVEQLPQSIFRKDLEGRVTFANSRYCRGMQRSLKDVLGKTDADLFPPDLAAKYRADDKRVIETGTVLETVERHRTPDGREFYVHVMKSPLRDVDGRIIGTQCIFWDVTGRKLAEDALRESERRLRLATEAAHMGTWERDLKNNKHLWSPTEEQLMGYETGTFPGTFEAFFELVHPDSHAALAAAQEKARETGNYSAELQFRLRDGRTRWGLVRGQIIYDDQGKPERMVGVDLDITSQKESTEQIARLNEKLEQRVQERTAELEASNKELEAFCYSVSHDLRAPLRSIDGFSALVVEECQSFMDATSLDYLQRVRAAAQQMGLLINDLLQLSRVTRCELRREQVDLSALANAVAGELKASQPNRPVRLSVEPGMVGLGDPHLLRVVLENLLSNAWKFTSLEREPHVEFRAMHENGLTAYFVRDNGAGFEMEYVHKLFTPFQRLHSVSDFPGTGVGLASVQRIIQRHGGRVWAEGAVGRGATFYFTLQTEHKHV